MLILNFSYNTRMDKKNNLSPEAYHIHSRMWNRATVLWWVL